VTHFWLNTVALVDGGLASLTAFDGVNRLVVSLGFGVDAFHSVYHAHVLRNLVVLDREGSHPPALSIPLNSPEGEA
jgi:hypothetical protein